MARVYAIEEVGRRDDRDDSIGRRHSTHRDRLIERDRTVIRLRENMAVYVDHSV